MFTRNFGGFISVVPSGGRICETGTRQLHHAMVLAVFAILLVPGLLVPPVAAQTSAPALVTIYAFNANISAGDGVKPNVPLLIGSGGVLYGATYVGGSYASPCNVSGCGTVFSLTPPSAGGSWTETQLYVFIADGDGAEPTALAINSAGVLYGTTAVGGKGCMGGGCGTAFALTPPTSPGNPWTKSTYAFSRMTVLPNSLRLRSGVLYGTSFEGGTVHTCFVGCGSVFSLKPPTAGGNSWMESTLYSFPSGTDGDHPIMAVTAPTGVVYGTSEGGDLNCPVGWGLVFSLTPPAPGDVWTETVLHSFTNQGNEGYGVAGLAIGSDGVLYGTTSFGGRFGLGTIFSLTPPAMQGGSWTETILHDFTGPPDAANPNIGLLIGTGGVLYGTSYYGGDVSCPGFLNVGCGAVFSLTPPASREGAWTEIVLHAFSGGNDGGLPVAGLTLGPNGTLYGTTTIYGGSGKFGTVFAIKP